MIGIMWPFSIDQMKKYTVPQVFI